jgi:hypothetical protein
MVIRDEPEPADIGIDTETLAYIVLKAKAFDALVAPDDPDDSSNATDDRFMDALEDESDNPTARELRASISGLNVDARNALVALLWLGRDDYEAEEWDEALTAARERGEGPTWRYLMGVPLLGDYLEAGADKLAISLTEEEAAGLATPDIETSIDVSGPESS